MSKAKKGDSDNSIAQNRKARHEFHIEDTFEAGLMLEGWEVKSLRAGKVSFNESYVLMKDGEAFLWGMHISPLLSASTHVTPNPTRTRKLLLHARELGKIHGAITKKGYTCVPLSLYWKNGRAKCLIALATGKQTHDKRQAEKSRDWNREKQRLVRKQ
ncbi:SsrA-binding protein [gamma proteobacterium HdN1]|nr:SsrA-binding protein [gamma proteobacterium HdN1]